VVRLCRYALFEERLLRHRRSAFRLCGKERARDPYRMRVFSLSSFFFGLFDFIMIFTPEMAYSYIKGVIL